MKRDYSRTKFGYQRQRAKALPSIHQKQAKSKRASEYLHEQAASLRHRVFLYLGLIAVIYLAYFLFYSDNFKIKHINISGSVNIPQEELEEIVKNSLAKNSWLIFPQDNYFLLSKKRLQKEFKKNYSLDELLIEKKSPQTLTISLTERTGQFIWVTNERIFLFDLKGVIFEEIPGRELVNTGMPIVYDNSNSEIAINDKVLTLDLINLISDVYQHLESYNLPLIEIQSFKADSPKANFIKIATKQGFEIHLDTILSLSKQFFKLKRSLEEGKIDLNKIEYINLRIENQVIYK